jgi:hypothetical protein
MPTVENAADRAGATDSLVRERLIDTARAAWANRLIDLSRRNNLLFYKPIASGTLELPFSQRMQDFLSDGQTATIGDLVASDKDKISAIRAISRKGLENFEEKGLLTLYLALGRCTWNANTQSHTLLASTANWRSRIIRDGTYFTFSLLSTFQTFSPSSWLMIL